MIRIPVVVCAMLGILASIELASGQDEQPAFTPKLRIAFSSYRRTARQPKVYFYDHDGRATGRITGTIESGNKESETHASLTADGSMCAMAHEVENKVSQVFLWNAGTKKFLELPEVNNSPNSQLCPTLSGNGRWMAFAGWSRPGGNQRWDVYLYDLEEEQLDVLSPVNSQPNDERMPALSSNGRWLAFTSNSKSGVGLVDVFLFDRQSKRTFTLPRANSSARDVDPSLSGDGRLLAFSSDREGGLGGRDILLFDRESELFVPLPGLNSVAHEQSPHISANGRYIAFVSERIKGEGERDIYVYDCESKSLLTTPDLNSAKEDLDPCVIVFPPSH